MGGPGLIPRQWGHPQILTDRNFAALSPKDIQSSVMTVLEIQGVADEIL